MCKLTDEAADRLGFFLLDLRSGLVAGDARSAGALCGALRPGAVDVGHIAVLRRFHQAVSPVRLQ